MPAEHTPCSRISWTTPRGTRVEIDQHNVWMDKNGPMESVGTINSYGRDGFGVTLFSRGTDQRFGSRHEAMWEAARQCGFGRNR